jgi:drug/metabolite transporter (DMT)-like permease
MAAAYHRRVPALSQTRAYWALLLIVLVWGSYPAAVKLALRDFPPLFFGVVRCAIASAFLVLSLVRSGEATAREVTPAALRAFLVLALTGIAGSTHLTYLAIHHTTAGNAVVLQCATPVMVALGARLYLGERLTPPQWLGVAASSLGVLLVITQGRLAGLDLADVRPGDLITLVSLCGWSAYTVYGKRVLATYSPALATTAAYVLGTLIMIPVAAAVAPLFPAPRLGSGLAWFVVVYQAIVGAVAHVWWYRAVDVVGASRAAIFMNLQPLVGLGLAAALLGEGIGAGQVLGGALVLAGVALTTGVRARARA